ncbi:MAG TPA: 3-oxoacyl-[acyl-carrier-protein] synthase III C-terminal domain-containing protein [Actinoplanes sp.]|nr:3-oxoacyl-[acyl-carrier-protein] synthase III C-terminal domain-containing protein [Actinoplanes sp.]
MTTLQAVATYLPQARRAVEEVGAELGLTPMQVRVFRRYYGFAEIRQDPAGTLLGLLDAAVGNLPELHGREARVRYVLHARSFAVVTPYPMNPLHELCRRRGLGHATAFAVSHQACASALVALDIAGRLLAADPDPDALALIVTGEQAFTAETRMVPDTSIFGEGAAACLVGRGGRGDRVLSYASRQRGEFDDAAGPPAESFQAQYPASLAQVILAALDRAGLAVGDIARILPHNVNAVAWQRVCRQLGIGVDRVVLDNLPVTGHVFCADAFFNLRYARANGLLAPGDAYVVAAAGAARGATFAAMVLEHRP